MTVMGLAHSIRPGQRVSQQLNATTPITYLLDNQPGLAKVIAATTGANTDRYIHDPRGIHSQEDSGGAWSHMANDGLGNVRGVYDDALAETYVAQYSPYGEIWDSAGRARSIFPPPSEVLGEKSQSQIRQERRGAPGG